MRETEYAFAVARVRANEPGLLTADDIEQLIASEDEKSAFRLLGDKGWDDPSEGKDIYDTEAEKAWDLISRSVPDPALLEALVIGNDYANVKAAIKTVFSDIDSEKYMVYPALFSPSEIIKAVNENDFSNLPDYLSDCADRAYHCISGGENGQSAEMIIDKACLEKRLECSKKAQCPLLERIVSILSLLANIKIAKRSLLTGKEKRFALDSMCECGFIDNEILVNKVYSGEELSDYISECGYPEIAAEADRDFSTLEMKCDNLITDLIKGARYDAFGPDPVVAYFYAKLAEIKNVRIILSAKSAGVPTETIRQRVRDMYV